MGCSNTKLDEVGVVSSEHLTPNRQAQTKAAAQAPLVEGSSSYNTDSDRSLHDDALLKSVACKPRQALTLENIIVSSMIPLEHHSKWDFDQSQVSSSVDAHSVCEGEGLQSDDIILCGPCTPRVPSPEADAIQLNDDDGESLPPLPAPKSSPAPEPEEGSPRTAASPVRPSHDSSLCMEAPMLYVEEGFGTSGHHYYSVEAFLPGPLLFEDGGVNSSFAAASCDSLVVDPATTISGLQRREIFDWCVAVEDVELETAS